jgi:predicted RNA methylase
MSTKTGQPHYALVVPASMRFHVTRVRAGLGVEVFVVDDDATISPVAD